MNILHIYHTCFISLALLTKTYKYNIILTLFTSDVAVNLNRKPFLWLFNTQRWIRYMFNTQGINPQAEIAICQRIVLIYWGNVTFCGRTIVKQRWPTSSDQRRTRGATRGSLRKRNSSLIRTRLPSLFYNCATPKSDISSVN